MATLDGTITTNDATNWIITFKVGATTVASLSVRKTIGGRAIPRRLVRTLLMSLVRAMQFEAPDLDCDTVITQIRGLQ